MTNNTIYYWACDKSNSSGEGKLALYYIKSLKEKKIIEIKKKRIKNKLLNKFFNYKYIIPFIGIIYCWKYHIQKKNICYVNYLPFWNFLIFLLLPPNSKIGPITGGASFEKNSSIIRKMLFPVFYKISELIVNYRNFNLIFSTNLLKKKLSKKTIRNSSFNFIIKRFVYKKKMYHKTIDFLVYFREHRNKKNNFPYKFIKNLIKEGFNVNIVGDYIKMQNVINLGFVDNKKLLALQKKTKFTIFSHENLYSIFTLECIQNNVLVIIDKSKKYDLAFFKNNFLKIDFKNQEEIKKIKNLF